MFTRRDFLRSSGLVAIGTAAPAFLGRTARATPDLGRAGAKDTILVMVQLTGGNDGLNTVVPFTDPAYAKARPTLALKADQVRKLDDTFGFHPAMGGLAKLYDDQKVAVVHGVGYPNPTQSHFRSMDIWQAASTADDLTEGWLGRALKQVKAPAFHLAYDNETAPLALAGAPVRAPSIKSLDDFQLQTAATTGSDRLAQRELIEGAARQPTGGSKLLQFVQKTAEDTYAGSRRLREIGRNYVPKAVYPQTALAERLRLAAQLIDADLGARVFYVSLDGFDTHASQGGTAGAHANLLGEVSGAVTAFFEDVSARGHGDRVLIATFSEFGRRVRENGSKGTDHGSAAPMLLVGGRVRPGLHGEHPPIDQLEAGNLRHNLDFRRVYAALLENWLGVSSRQVLDGDFPPCDLIRA